LAKDLEYKPSEKDKKAIEEIQRCIDEGKRWHNQFAKKVERRYEAWRGLLPENAPKPQGWRSNQHPPYLINIVEGMLASIEEQNPIWEVNPRALPGMTADMAMESVDRAEIASYLLTHQMRIDDFSAKAGPLAHQDLIAGLTVGKVFWLKKAVKTKEYESSPEYVYDEAGGTIDIANNISEYESELVTRDDPTLEVRDDPLRFRCPLVLLRVIDVAANHRDHVGRDPGRVEAQVGQRPEHLLHRGESLDHRDAGDLEEVGDRRTDDEGLASVRERVRLVAQQDLPVTQGHHPVVRPKLDDLVQPARSVHVAETPLALGHDGGVVGHRLVLAHHLHVLDVLVDA